jgi:hypothetical protein
VQNRYTGDVGDFGKFGLLRVLAPENSGVRLGLIWYLYPDEEGNADGKYVQYLDPSEKNDCRFRACDSKLYDALRKLVDSGNRRVDQVPKLGILPGRVFFDEQLRFPGPPAERPAAREGLARAGARRDGKM